MQKFNSLWRRAGMAAGAALSLLLAACYETDQKFTLNPDGSGKVVHECRFAEFNLGIGGAGQPDEESLKRVIAEIMEKSKGIDAWDDVHFERLDDGRILFRGTALFPDLSKLKIHNQTIMSFGWTRDPSGNGELVVAFNENDETAAVPDNAAAAEKGPPADEEGRRRWLVTERAKFQQARPMLLSIVSGIRQTASFRLPGSAGETRHFKDAGDDGLRITFEGAKFVDALDALIADDAWLLSNGFNSDGPPALDEAMTTGLFGSPGVPVAARPALGEPLFDYQAEVAAARENSAVLRDRLGPAAARAMPPAQGGPLASARVAGIRLSKAVDPALELRPFNHDAGLAIALICEFDGAILSISDQSAVETAITDNGTSLLPDSDFNRRLRWPNFSPCRTHAMFDISLDPPSPGAESLRDLAGTIHYSVAEGSREVNLGFAKVAAGEPGTELGAEITELKDGWREDGPLDLSVRLNLPLDDLKAMFLVDGDERVQLERRGYSSGGNVTTYTFELPRDFKPESGLVAELYDEIKNYTTQFILRDIKLPSLAED